MADRPKSRYLTFSILHIVTLMCQDLRGRWNSVAGYRQSLMFVDDEKSSEALLNARKHFNFGFSASNHISSRNAIS
ncbi:hypothetical protein M0802_003344 [Mischocyttarus mexicanus]|nr:hypothetical protein M0802_003344 [Mischocyttarus mexicanus]